MATSLLLRALFLPPRVPIDEAAQEDERDEADDLPILAEPRPRGAVDPASPLEGHGDAQADDVVDLEELEDGQDDAHEGAAGDEARGDERAPVVAPFGQLLVLGRSL